MTSQGRFVNNETYHIVSHNVNGNMMQFFGQSPPTNFIFVDELEINSPQILSLAGDVIAEGEMDGRKIRSKASFGFVASSCCCICRTSSGIID
jgi:hypothetical protein